ncbi:MAG: hypothetical protein ICV82_04915 [Nitrososphaera sp.]|nr:hypothetical protein [Nitrososphaera sp.]
MVIVIKREVPAVELPTKATRVLIRLPKKVKVHMVIKQGESGLNHKRKKETKMPSGITAWKRKSRDVKVVFVKAAPSGSFIV